MHQEYGCYQLHVESLDPGFKKCSRFRSLNSRGERALERTGSYEAVYVTEGALVHKNICDSFFIQFSY